MSAALSTDREMRCASGQQVRRGQAARQTRRHKPVGRPAHPRVGAGGDRRAQCQGQSSSHLGRAAHPLVVGGVPEHVEEVGGGRGAVEAVVVVRLAVAAVPAAPAPAARLEGAAPSPGRPAAAAAALVARLVAGVRVVEVVGPGLARDARAVGHLGARVALRREAVRRHLPAPAGQRDHRALVPVAVRALVARPPEQQHQPDRQEHLAEQRDGADRRQAAAAARERAPLALLEQPVLVQQRAHRRRLDRRVHFARRGAVAVDRRHRY